MTFIIVMSTGDFQIRSGKWPLGLSDLYHNYLISNDCIQHSGKISISNT